jgi:hypothetical protein
MYLEIVVDKTENKIEFIMFSLGKCIKFLDYCRASNHCHVWFMMQLTENHEGIKNIVFSVNAFCHSLRGFLSSRLRRCETKSRFCLVFSLARAVWFWPLGLTVLSVEARSTFLLSLQFPFSGRMTRVGASRYINLALVVEVGVSSVTGTDWLTNERTNWLTDWLCEAEFFVTGWQVPCWSRNSPHFMVPEG